MVPTLRIQLSLVAVVRTRKRKVQVREIVQSVTIGEAALSFLTGLSPDERKESQQEVNRFSTWYGKEQPISKLTVYEVASYGEKVIASHANPAQRLAPVRALLTYAKKEKMIEVGLASHLGIRKTSSKTLPSQKPLNREPMTPETHTRLQAELQALKEERPYLAEEIHKAAADKDFRENAPLDAAKEHQGHVEGRIQELEFLLNAAIMMEENISNGQQAVLNSTVVVCDIASGKELRYTLVTSRETAPLKGKISIESPVGKALLNRQRGETVEIEVPSCKLSYRIEEILH